MRRDDADRARRLSLAGLLCLCSLVLPAATPGRPHGQSSPDKKDQAVIRCRIALVIVEVEVKDSNGSPVLNLSHDQFRVYEDGQRQTISIFTDERDSVPEGSPVGYKLGYLWNPSESTEWQFRRIRVRVRNQKALGIIVTTDRAGYFVAPRGWESNGPISSEHDAHFHRARCHWQV